ncbi:MAG: NfeD family protein [Thermoprotei archaeon]|nr:NfeD family protein [Thermoprotei archaeon]
MKILEVTIALLDEIIIVTVIVGALTFMAVALNVIGLGEALVIGAVLIVVIALITYKVVEAHKAKVKVGIETYIGKKAKVVEAAGKTAIIMVEGELWKAESETETTLSSEDTVIIVGFEEGKFIVKPLKEKA